MLIVGGHNGAAAHGDKCVFGVFSHYKIKSKGTAEITGDLLGISSTVKGAAGVCCCPTLLCPSLPCLVYWACLLLYWETLQIMAGGGRK